MKTQNKKRSALLVFFLILNITIAFCQNRKADSLLKIYNQEKNDTVKIKLLLRVAKSYKNKNPDTAIYFLRKTIAEIEKSSNKKALSSFLYKRKIEANTQMGIIFETKTDYDNSIKCYLIAKEIAVENNYKIGIASAEQNISLHYYNKSDYEKAIEHCLKAIKTQTELNDKKALPQLYSNLGLFHKNKGDYKAAVEAFFKGFSLSKEVNDSLGIMSCSNNMGQIYLDKKDLIKAEEYFNTAYKISIALNVPEYTAPISTNLGHLFSARKNYQKALEYYQVTLSMCLELHHDGGIRDAYGNIGNMYFRLSQFDKAYEFHQKSLEISKKYNDSLAIAASFNNLATFKAAAKNYKEAILLHQQALEMALKIKDFETQEHALQGLYEVYELAGDYKNALTYKKKVDEIKDSTLNAKNFEAIANLRADFEIEQKEKEQSLIMKAKEVEQKAALDRQKMINISLSIGAILILITAGVAFKAYLSKKKDNKLIADQKKEVEFQKHIIEERNNDIMDSINYAKRIQESILPSMNNMNQALKNGFVLFKPKDVVAGDFFWMEVYDNKVYFAAADCTGHGVPGALVSVVCSNALSKALLEEKKTNTGQLLDKTREIVISRFSKSGEEVKDGMDISLCAIDFNHMTLQWSGANNPLWIVRNGELIEIKPDKQPIGKYAEEKPFTSHDITLHKNDSIYIFTDGYADQFGGEKGKKLKASKMKEKILAIQTLSMDDQKSAVREEFESWKGLREQVDDVCVIGVKI